MNEFMRLADETEIPIEEGGSLASLIHIAPNEPEAMAICELVTPENLAHVEFGRTDLEEPYGVYDNLAKAAEPYRYTNEDETITVVISLREKTDLELRVDALEESQEVQDGAIEDLGAAVSEIAEG